MRRSALVVILVVGTLLVPLAVFASHQFTDVPDSHTFHNAIDWMKDNNITVGCNPPTNNRYCPDDNVTRGQMAAFMKRLAENQVVDAATLRGQGTAAYQSPIWGTSIDVFAAGAAGITGSEIAGNIVLTLPVSPAADGILEVGYSVGFSGEMPYAGWVWLQFDDNTCHLMNDHVDGSAYPFEAETNLTDRFRQLSAIVGLDASAGGHRLYLCAANTGSNPFVRLSASLVAQFSAVGLVSG
jgi:hypothetical protein